MQALSQAVKWFLLLLIQAYRLGLSPFVGARCRFFPTCSEYTHEAITRHGVMQGSYLGAKRILRCRPGGGSGIDEVPEQVNPLLMNKRLGAWFNGLQCKACAATSRIKLPRS